MKRQLQLMQNNIVPFLTEHNRKFMDGKMVLVKLFMVGAVFVFELHYFLKIFDFIIYEVIWKEKECFKVQMNKDRKKVQRSMKIDFTALLFC